MENKRGRKISKQSEEIISLLKSGMSWFEIHKTKGYSRMTCKYYYWKIKKPKQYKKFVAKVAEIGKKKYAEKSR